MSVKHGDPLFRPVVVARKGARRPDWCEVDALMRHQIAYPNQDAPQSLVTGDVT